MKQDVFDHYLENLDQESKKSVCFGSIYDKALFQGAMMGFLACDKEHTFTGKQVAEIMWCLSIQMDIWNIRMNR